MDNLIIKNFIDYWDKTISDWAKSHKLPENEEIFLNLKNGNFKKELMPEPYWGNPKNCSVAILNYNPACSEQPEPYDTCHLKNVKNERSLSGKLSPHYSKEALEFHHFDENPDCPYRCFAGTIWWRSKRGWLNNLTGNDKKKPFALELISWHSPGWKIDLSKKSNSKIKDILKKNVIDIFIEAIKNSDLKIGYCFGKHIANLFDALKYTNITNRLFSVNNGKWQPLENKMRWYSVYVLDKIRGIYTIVTWSIRSNTTPAKEYFEIEKNLIKEIKNLITN